ncbi:WD40 repeat domain-containing serine/threonine protein kinase [Thermomonospora umbrina]|uniref:Serine/threonine protein kinase n=1 Tax=Thermomonospora umbrina TaxID=111806 RepID=A0A3D9SNB3_9ACTN|nr:WD40 repeat domain-containing serine/threonine protein kinase [Thermomonospora umbrina]REE95920.1 serine/threonine protein kinase [Thermomonospora umbrina]
MAAPLQSTDPRHLGSYWLAGRLGAGGQGVVYEGYDAAGTRVAVKALHVDAINDVYRDQLSKEVAALGRVASFCTARVIETDLDHVPPYLVSEYVPGPNLQSWVEHHGPYGPDELFRLAIGIATALASIHQAGVVHRDLKPANVLLGPDGPRVIDFGIARTEEMSRSATAMKGTPRWMAPEVFQGRPATAAVDIWAWGTVVLYAATGRPPFDADTLPSIAHQVLNTRPDLGAVPPSLLTLVERALSRDPAGRPTARELLEGLIGNAPLEAGKSAAAALPAAGIAPSLAETAEQAYANLDPEARAAVPRVLLRMVGSTPGSFRAVAFPDLLDSETSEAVLNRVLAGLIGAGILVHDGGRFSLAGPALVRAWPRLRAWAADESPVLEAHHTLADAARRWNDHGRKPGDLLHGTSLDEAITGAVAGRRHLTLNLLERAYLDGSITAARRRGRNRTLLSVALAVLLVLSTGTAGTSVMQSRSLSDKNEAISQQRDEAISSQVADVATGLRRVDPLTARRLAVVAGALAPDSFDTRNALVTLYHQWEEGSYAPPGIQGSWGKTFADQGRLLAYAKDRNVKIVDLDARRVVREFTVPGTPIVRFQPGLSMSDDGKVISVLHQDGTVEIHDVATGRPRPVTFKVPEPYVALNPDGTRVLSIQNKRTLVRDTATAKVVFERPYHFTAAVMTGKSLIGSRGAELEVWDLETRKEIRVEGLRLGKEDIEDLAVSAKGDALAVRQGERTLRVVLLGEGTTVTRTIPTVKRYGSLDFTPDSRYVRVGGTIWDPTSAHDVPVFRYNIEDCYNDAFGPGGRTLRCVDSRDQVNDISLRTIHDTARLGRPAPFVDAAALSGDGSTLVVQTAQTLDVWDPVKRVMRGSLPIPSASSDGNYVLSRDGRLLADIRRDGRIELWDVPAKAKTLTLTTNKRLVTEQPVAFSPDGRTLATLTYDDAPTVLDLWDVRTGTRRATSTGQTATPSELGAGFSIYGDPQILFSPDSRTVVSSVDQGVVDVATGKRLVPPAGLDSARAIDPRGLIAAARERTVEFWDSRSLRPTATAWLGSPPEGAMAFSEDGLVAASDGYGRIRLWDIRRKRALGLHLTGHHVAEKDAGEYYGARAVVFTRDGSHVLSLDDKGRLRTHLIDPAAIRADLCRRLGPLPPADWRTHVPSLPYRKTC